ncbi:MAG: ATP-binding cassette domain-containing protein, partial [Spirochaetales bacterium]|nr:ATP-binding cassette domain-containing protein [Spirochaetales bacterium]
MTAIKADKLCFTYPYEKKPAINGLTFSLEKGESLAVMGSNGSGKSTLIRLLSGLLVPTSGSVVTDGIALSDKKSRKEVKRHIQSVFQEPSGQFVTATPREEARLVAGLFDRSEDDIGRIFCEYACFMDREFAALSGGEKQKMALALAMLTGASVLVFDEALSSLDPKERKDFLEIILSLKAEGRTVVYITQEADEALLFDKLLILDDGAFAPP